ncbi:hypothetical protein ACIQOW_20650 [Kitasatospora sp. NPDC091335]|uniref:hypothetical protein n=1 Tax=unclassified Kitasatospora TaxID=2633591 RepID=UPI0037C15E97
MRSIKVTHSYMWLEHSRSWVLVTNPGIWSESRGLAGASGVMATYVPWSKSVEAIDFARVAAPECAFRLHGVQITERGLIGNNGEPGEESRDAYHRPAPDTEA